MFYPASADHDIVQSEQALILTNTANMSQKYTMWKTTPF